MNTVKRPFKLNKKLVALCIIFAVLVVLLVVSFIIGAKPRSGDISEELTDAVLHEEKKISLFGWPVNPAAISGIAVTILLLIFAACVRIFAIPRFKDVPGKFQLLIEKLVGFFDGMAQSNSPHRNNFMGCYIFSAGCYICIGTLFELLGIQWTSTGGYSVSLPAPLSDINGAIAMGFLSYFVILGGGIVSNGLRGMVRALKDFSLPISMSFRLFGALLSGLLVTELVYYTISLSIVLPVIVGVLFTLIHALIQTFVLVTLVSTFYGESTEPYEKKPKASKHKKAEAAA